METSNLTITPPTNTASSAVNSTEVFSSSAAQGLAPQGWAAKISLDKEEMLAMSGPNSSVPEDGGQETAKVEEDVMSAVVKEGTPRAGLEALAVGEDKGEEEAPVQNEDSTMNSLMSEIKEVAGQDSDLRDRARNLEQQLVESNAMQEKNQELLILLRKFIEELQKKDQNNGILGALLELITAMIINLNLTP